jgi:hypothetical protein
MTNLDKVEEKMEKELDEKIREGKSREEIEEIEEELNPHNVKYKLKDKTDD